MDIPKLLCEFAKPNFFIFSDKVPDAVYFSHLPILLLAMVIGIYVFTRNWTGLSNRLVFCITGVFSIWVFLDLIFWASNEPKIIMFVWSIQILIEPLVHLLSLGLFYELIFKKRPNFYFVLLLLILYLPLIVITPTDFLLDYFNLSNCLSHETIFSYYSYLIEFTYTSLIILFTIKDYISNKSIAEKLKTLLVSFGLISLLITFSWGAIIGSFSSDWLTAQYGLFGMPIFIIILFYSIKKFNSISFKLILSEIMVVSILIINGSLLAIQNIETGHVIILTTFIISVIMGIVIIRHINRESLHLAQISSLAASLKHLNETLEDKVAEQTAEIKKSYELERNAHRELEKFSETKDKFISIAQHNLRIPITNIQNRIENLLNNSSSLPSQTLKQLEETRESLDNLNNIADDFKNISQIKRGSQFLNLSKINLLSITENILKELSIDINKMQIAISFPTAVDSWPILNIDKNKIKDALMVVIENAIKYNKQNGFINISTNTNNNLFKIKIENSGLGLTKEEKENLDNHTFYRSNRVKNINPIGMGIGLNLAKSTVEAHHGNLKIESNGENMGATVEISIPIDFLAQS